jgi:hypothetical protein
VTEAFDHACMRQDTVTRHVASKSFEQIHITLGFALFVKMLSPHVPERIERGDAAENPSTLSPQRPRQHHAAFAEVGPDLHNDRLLGFERQGRIAKLGRILRTQPACNIKKPGNSPIAPAEAMEKTQALEN